MLSLSTSFAANRFDNGEALVKALEDFGVQGIELEYRITEKIFHQVRPALKTSSLQVTSVHNFFPHPALFAKMAPSGDLFSLSDTDKDRRQLAVKWTQRTIEQTNDLEARTVVLHCGRVDMAPEVETLYRYFKEGTMESEPARDFFLARLEMLDRFKPPHLDALCFSLDKLLGVAEQNSVTLALENRFHYHELPGPEDFQRLFNEFCGAPLGYWHDTGHAQAAHLLGLIPMGELPPGCREHLAGIHLHDAKALDDHLAPGAGEIDFSPVLALAGNDIALVMELRPGTPDDAVRDGLAHLRQLLAQTPDP